MVWQRTVRFRTHGARQGGTVPFSCWFLAPRSSEITAIRLLVSGERRNLWSEKCRPVSATRESFIDSRIAERPLWTQPCKNVLWGCIAA